MNPVIRGSLGAVKRFSVSLSSALDGSHHRLFKTVNGTFFDVIETATAQPWSPIVWENNQRRKSGFKACSLVVLDIDDDFPIADAEVWLRKLNFYSAILLSKSHQIQKGEKPPCDRYRIVIDAEEITDLAQYEANMKFWLGLLPMADKACKDGARFFFASPQLAYIQAGDRYAWQDMSAVIAREQRNEQERVQYRVERFKSGGAISEGLRNFILRGVPKGQRHSACYWAACALADLGLERNEMVRLIAAGAFSELGVAEIERAVDNAKRRGVRSGKN